MKKITFISLLALSFNTFAQTKCIAHRGYHNVAPDNSIASFVAAQSVGADGIELDIVHTKEGIPIVNHDDFLATKYDGLPVLWTWDYSEITEDYLNNEYDKILDQSFDFSKILLSCYDQLKREILQKS